MFIKNIPLASIRGAATQACAQWRQVVERCAAQDWNGAIVQAGNAQKTLAAGDVIALPLTIEAWSAAMAKDECRKVALDHVALIEQEIDHLSNGQIFPSLCLAAPTTALATSAGARVYDEGFFFLPAAPIAKLIPTQSMANGSPKDAAEVYSKEFQDCCLKFFSKPGIEAVRELRRTAHSIDNRMIRGNLGLYFTLAFTWLDAACDSPNLLTRNDILLLARLDKLLKGALTDEAVSDNLMVSALSFRVSRLSTQRGLILSRRMGLAEMTQTRTLTISSEPVMTSSNFEILWQNAVSAWEQYFQQRDAESFDKVNAELSQIVAVGAQDDSIALLAFDALRILGQLADASFLHKDGARTMISEIFSLMQNFIHSAGSDKANLRVSACHDAVDRLLSGGGAQSITTNPVLPINDFLKEIGEEITKAINALTKSGDKDGALVHLNIAVISLSMILNTEEGKALDSVLNDLINKLIDSNDPVFFASFLTQFKQATDLMPLNKQAALSLLTDIDATEVVDIRVSTDKVEDAEIFDIFMEEVDGIFKEMEDLCQDCLKVHAISIAQSTSLRRYWHTIKGSARMSGLMHFGDAAYEFEKALTDCSPRGPLHLDWAQANLKGAELAKRICKSLRQSGESSVDANQFHKAIALSTRSRPAPVAPIVVAAAPAPVISISVPAAPVPAPVAAVFQMPVMETPAIEVSAIEEFDAIEIPAIDVIASALAPATETPAIDAPSFTKPVTLDDASAYTLDPDVLAAFSHESLEMINIILDHTEDIPVKGVTYELVRAAHSLAGMARIVEAADLEVLAEALEQWSTYHLSRKRIPGVDSLVVLQAIGQEASKVVIRFLQNEKYIANLDLARELLSYGSDEFGAESLSHNSDESSASESKPVPVKSVSEHISTPVSEFNFDGLFAEVEPNDQAPSIQVLILDEPSLAPVTVEVMGSPDADEVETALPELAEITAPVAAVLEPTLPEEDLVAETLPELAEITAQSLPVLAIVVPKPLGMTATPTAQSQPRPLTAMFVLDDSVSDDVDPDVLASFTEEAEDCISEIDVCLSSFVPGTTSFSEVNRLLHTLKGGARLCGLLRLGVMLHKMEDVTTKSIALSAHDAKALVSAIQHSLDSVREVLREATDAVAQAAAGPADSVALQPVMREESSVLRIDPARLDSVSDMLAQISITQNRIKKRTVDGFGLIDGMKDPIRRIQTLAHLISLDAESRMDAGNQQLNHSNEFDALEMDRFTTLQEQTRRLLEAVNDASNIFEGSETVLQDVNEAMRQQMELSSSVQHGIDSIGRSTLTAAKARIRATLRQSAEDCHKDCDVQIMGDVSIERAVMDKLIPVIEHMLRNSVAHGIESSAVRLALGKPSAGLISLSSRRMGSYAEVVLSDDGAGIDFGKVRAKAALLGLIKKGHTPSDEELTEFLFSSGFSTADQVNYVAGRGVGLDAVRDSVTRLGGRVSLKSVSGQGVEFKLTVPLTSGYVSGLMIEAGGSPYIIPSALIKGVEMVNGKALAVALAAPGSPLAMQDGALKTLYEVGYLCGVQSKRTLGNFHQVIVPHGHEDTVIFGDHLEYINNLPLRQFHNDVSMGAGVIGYSLLSDGRIGVVINPDLLLALNKKGTFLQSEKTKTRRTSELMVMVVDDSITVRASTTRLLTRNGFRVETAENGAIAMEKIAKDMPTVILMDIEMPVMDGFETTKAIKANDLFKHIPISFISSRNADKHRSYAYSIGAAAFFGKPYKDDELLDWIKEEFAKVAVEVVEA